MSYRPFHFIIIKTRSSLDDRQAHVQKAAIAPHEMAAMVGIGREKRAAMTDLKDSTIWWRRRRAEGWPQGASTPL